MPSQVGCRGHGGYSACKSLGRERVQRTRPASECIRPSPSRLHSAQLLRLTCTILRPSLSLRFDSIRIERLHPPHRRLQRLVVVGKHPRDFLVGLYAGAGSLRFWHRDVLPAGNFHGRTGFVVTFFIRFHSHMVLALFTPPSLSLVSIIRRAQSLSKNTHARTNTTAREACGKRDRATQSTHTHTRRRRQ